MILALVGLSYVTMDRDSMALRQQVMLATSPGWATKVQVNLGQATIGAIDLGLRFVDDRKVADVHLALAAIKRASVGVYERTSVLADCSKEKLFKDSDQVMEKQGWTRLVGVIEEKDTVLIYTPRDTKPDQHIDVCFAVISGKELVVGSANVDAVMIEELVKNHIPGELKDRLLPAAFLARN